MSDNIMTVIDNAAKNFYQTKNKKWFNVFVRHATPIIRQIIMKSCAGSNWDTEDLFSILLVDMWRLFNRWVPKEEKPFHWLMLRQLRNKTINYVHSQIGRPHKICPICSKRQEKESLYCQECKSSLRISDIVVPEPFAHVHAHSPDYLTQIANTDLINQLLEEVKKDSKTHRILVMLLNGETKTTISKEIGIAQNALNNRLRKCKGIISKLTKE